MKKILILGLVVLIFGLGYSVGVSNNRQQLTILGPSEAAAANTKCATITYSGVTSATNHPSYSCAAGVFLDRVPDYISKEGRKIWIYFK